jgi:hypothetical protein
MTAAGFRKLLARIGQAAKFPFPVHPHTLRHGCGYKLAHDGHDTRGVQEWLGHTNIRHTTRHTGLTTKRPRDFRRREDGRGAHAGVATPAGMFPDRAGALTPLARAGRPVPPPREDRGKR